MRQHIAGARLLILQGGWGAISEAMELGKRIVVLPRRDKEEHIHDQFQLIRKLDALGCVVGVFDERNLPAAVKKAETFEFRQLPKGAAENIILNALDSWGIRPK